MTHPQVVLGKSHRKLNGKQSQNDVLVEKHGGFRLPAVVVVFGPEALLEL